MPLFELGDASGLIFTIGKQLNDQIFVQIFRISFEDLATVLYAEWEPLLRISFAPMYAVITHSDGKRILRRSRKRIRRSVYRESHKRCIIKSCYGG
jgi:hypothetical protein